jgi:hypothetical protein
VERLPANREDRPSRGQPFGAYRDPPARDGSSAQLAQDALARATRHRVPANGPSFASGGLPRRTPFLAAQRPNPRRRLSCAFASRSSPLVRRSTYSSRRGSRWPPGRCFNGWGHRGVFMVLAGPSGARKPGPAKPGCQPIKAEPCWRAAPKYVNRPVRFQASSEHGGNGEARPHSDCGLLPGQKMIK